MFDFVPDQYITQGLCDKAVSEDTLMLKYCPNKQNTQKICDKAVESYLLPLKFVPDWFVTSKMIEKIDSAVFYHDYIIFANLVSNFFRFFGEDFSHNSTILDNIKKLLIVLELSVV